MLGIDGCAVNLQEKVVVHSAIKYTMYYIASKLYSIVFSIIKVTAKRNAPALST